MVPCKSQCLFLPFKAINYLGDFWIIYWAWTIMNNLFLLRQAVCFSSHFLVPNSAHTDGRTHCAPWPRKISFHSSAVSIFHRSIDFQILLHITISKSVIITTHFACIRTSYLQVYNLVAYTQIERPLEGSIFIQGKESMSCSSIYLLEISDTTYQADDICTLFNAFIS